MNPAWRVSREGMQEALRDLGVRNRVRVQVVTFLPDFMLGRMRTMPDGSHEIQVNANQGTAEANYALLHELRHCWQVETYGDDALISLCQHYTGIDGYMENPVEKDAFAYANQTHLHIDAIRGGR